MRSPEVSIIVPCYNQAHFLQPLLQSVGKATSRAHEVIIVNDGSTHPATPRHLDRLTPATEYQKLCVIEKSNGGLASARNVGIRNAKGGAIQLLDADDLLLPSSIDSRLNYLPLSDVVISNFLFCNAECNRFWSPEPPTITEDNLNFLGVARFWERGLSIPIHTGLFKTELLKEVPFNETLKAKEDWLFWMELFLKTKSVRFLPEPGCIYRMHNANMTRDGRQMALSWIDAILLAKRKFPHFDEMYYQEAVGHLKTFYLNYFWTSLGAKFVERAYNSYIAGVGE